MTAVVTSPSPRGLQRILGLGFGLAVIIGSTIGIGILRTPGLVAGQLGDPGVILAVWLAGGLYTLVGAVCLAELGTMLPAAGGYYVYARRAFGENVGFAVGWTDWLTYAAVLGYISIGLGEFAALLAPGLAPMVTPIAIAALLGFVGLQWTGVRVSSRFQEAATAIKFAAFLALVIGCIAFGWNGPRSMGLDPAPTFAGLIIALQSVVITFGGWQSALYFTEEDRDPQRNLPRAMIGGVAAVIVVYLLVNIALLSVMTVSEMTQSTLPAADAAQIVMGGRGRQIITILSIVSLAPLLNAIMMIGTRILYAMARDGMLPARAATVNAGGTPTVATLVTTAAAMVLIATGTFRRLVAVASFFLAVNYFVCCLSLIVLRRREPDAIRPFRAWGYPWSAGIVAIGAGIFLAGALMADTPNAALALALLVAGLGGRMAIRPGRRTNPIVSLVAVLSLALGIGANTAMLTLIASSLAVQAAPGLSGTWTIDANRSAAIGGGTGQRDAGGGRGGGLGLGAAPDGLTIRQDAIAITVEERRGTTTTSLNYALDGSKTTNTVPAGRNSGASATYVTAWRNRRLVTRITLKDAEGSGGVVTYEEVRYLDAGGSLVVETTMAGRPNKRTTVYTRVLPP